MPAHRASSTPARSDYLENDVLKQDWNFPGFITSDYGALHATVRGSVDGTDQEQP